MNPITQAKLTLRDFSHKWRPLPLPERSFKGQVVCVTGSTAGLGLAAAIHFVKLGADEVIITYRDEARGIAAKRHILDSTTSLTLDHYASIVEFANEIKKIRAGHGGIDYVLLNAGVIHPDYVESPEGWPEEIQVNTLSTILLALLLLPWMMEERKNRQAPSHLGITSSMVHLMPNISKWPSWADTDGVVGHWKTKSNWPGPRGLHAGYGLSKLLMMYCVAEMAKLAYGGEERPQVIVNTMCPGAVSTEIIRHFEKAYPRFSVILKPLSNHFPKTAENGARILVVCGLTQENEQGHFKARYISQDEYQRLWARFGTSEVSRKLQTKAWTETVDILTASVPELKPAMEQLSPRLKS